MSQIPTVTRKWEINNGVLENELDIIIAVISDNATRDERKMMELAPLAFAAIDKFVSDVNSGTHKPRAAVKEFEKILEQL